MSNIKFAAGVVLAGALAFGLNFAAVAITAPMLHGFPSGSSAGENEPLQEEPQSENFEAQLIGRWQAPEPANQDAFVEFDEYGLWTGSDGCNGAEGNWTVDSDGGFDGGVGGAMTLMWCDNVEIPTAVWGATSITITEDDELILTSDDDEEMQLVRTGDTAFSLVGSWKHEGDEPSMVEFASDGTWTGGVGCAEFTGTWKLGVRNVPVLEDESTEPAPPVLLSGPGSLVIGPEPADPGATCAGAPDEFVLNYDTSYVFYNNGDGSFELGSTEPGEMADQPALRFTRG